MAVLAPKGQFTFVVHFVPPSPGESDFLWENFRDLILVHTNDTTHEIDVQAIRHGNEAMPRTFTPPETKLATFREFPDMLACREMMLDFGQRQVDEARRLEEEKYADEPPADNYYSEEKGSEMDQAPPAAESKELTAEAEQAYKELQQVEEDRLQRQQEAKIERAPVHNLCDARSVIAQMRMKGRSSQKPAAKTARAAPPLDEAKTVRSGMSFQNRDQEDLHNFQQLIHKASTETKATAIDKEREFYRNLIERDMKKQGSPPKKAAEKSDGSVATDAKQSEGARAGVRRARQVSYDDEFSSSDEGEGMGRSRGRGHTRKGGVGSSRGGIHDTIQEDIQAQAGMTDFERQLRAQMNKSMGEGMGGSMGMGESSAHEVCTTSSDEEDGGDFDGFSPSRGMARSSGRGGERVSTHSPAQPNVQLDANEHDFYKNLITKDREAKEMQERMEREGGPRAEDFEVRIPEEIDGPMEGGLYDSKGVSPQREQQQQRQRERQQQRWQQEAINRSLEHGESVEDLSAHSRSIRNDSYVADDEGDRQGYPDDEEFGMSEGMDPGVDLFDKVSKDKASAFDAAFDAAHGDAAGGSGTGGAESGRGDDAIYHKEDTDSWFAREYANRMASVQLDDEIEEEAREEEEERANGAGGAIRVEKVQEYAAALHKTRQHKEEKQQQQQQQQRAMATNRKATGRQTKARMPVAGPAPAPSSSGYRTSFKPGQRLTVKPRSRLSRK
jgi:hypothetical protein